MKNSFLVSSLIILLSFTGFAQYNKIDIYKVSKVVFYGLDFSNAKLVGTEGFTDPVDIKNRLFDSWNSLILTEPEKYDIAKYFHLISARNDLSIVAKRNNIPDVDDLVTDESYSFDEEKVKSIIAEYNTEGGEGIGLVFIIESFNKLETLGHMWVTFFDIASREVLYTEHFSGKPGGFGLRNYWAKSYHNVLKNIDKEAVKRWKKEFFNED